MRLNLGLWLSVIDPGSLIRPILKKFEKVFVAKIARKREKTAKNGKKCQ